MIVRFTKTDTEDWSGRDCCRIDLSSTDVRSPYFGDIAIWDGYADIPLDGIADYIIGRKSLEGIILGPDPLCDKDLYGTLKTLRRTKMPIRVETWGTRPSELDDFAGAMMIDSVLLRLTSSPASPSFQNAMPGADPDTVSETLDLLQRLDIDTEVELIAVPGAVDENTVKDVARRLGRRTLLTIRQYNPRLAATPEARMAEPLPKKDVSSLAAAARPFSCKSAVRWI